MRNKINIAAHKPPFRTQSKLWKQEWRPNELWSMEYHGEDYIGYVPAKHNSDYADIIRMGGRKEFERAKKLKAMSRSREWARRRRHSP